MERPIITSVKVGLGLVSYKGPDVHVFDQHLEFLHYLGRLQERSYWLQGRRIPNQERIIKVYGHPKLNRIQDNDLSELKDGDPVFEFSTITVTGNSLIGQARDMVIDRALEAKLDYLLFFDDDMLFAHDAFLRLWRHQLPVVGALSFTARVPLAPVLYSFKRTWNFDKQLEDVGIQPIFYYEQDKLIQIDAIGTGFVLFNVNVFRQIKRPWFHGSINCGEDIHFCWQCAKAGIPVHCDTSVKTIHRPNQNRVWHDEAEYLRHRAEVEAKGKISNAG